MKAPLKLANEKDPAVLGTMIRMVGFVAAKSEKVSAAILAATDNPAKDVRWHAAIVLPQSPAALAKLQTMAEKETDQDLRDLACSELAGQGEAALPFLDKMTKDGARPACFEPIVKLWASYPKFDVGSEKA